MDSKTECKGKCLWHGDNLPHCCELHCPCPQVNTSKTVINYCLLCESEECIHIKEALERKKKYKLEEKNIIWH